MSIQHLTPELVATVPDDLGAAFPAAYEIRTTLGVLVEIVAGAKSHLVIGAPYIQGEGALQSGPLGDALRAAIGRGVAVDIASTGISLANIDLAALGANAETRVRLFRARRNIDDPRTLGSHAKFVISDGSHAYVGSANVTEKGLGHHLEIGVLLHGREAIQLSKLVKSLFDEGYFEPVGE